MSMILNFPIYEIYNKISLCQLLCKNMFKTNWLLINYNMINIGSYSYNKDNIINNVSLRLPSHPYHVVGQSPWPFSLSWTLLSLVISAVLFFHGYPLGDYLLFFAFILLIWGMFLWFKDITTEASYQGYHTDKVQKGLSLGVILFIISEVFFFLSIFWAYFHSSLAPTIEIGSDWPPKAIETVNVSEVPSANTTILLSSGSSITICHHSLVNQMMSWANYGSVSTIFLGAIFTLLQVLEYFGVGFSLTDSIFGSVFFMGTGLILGPIIFFINKNNFLKKISSQIISEDIINNSLIINESKESKGISPYWITGFADAESRFVIRVAKTIRKQGWRIIPLFSIELHIKDLSLLKEVQSYFGVGKIHIRMREGRTTSIYSVQSIKDLNNIIIPHFIKYPLLTQKRIDFEFFYSIINLMNKKEHLNIEGVFKIISIKASMNKGLSEELKKAFPSIILTKRPINFFQNIKDPQWLTGFVDGEGCFHIHIRKSQFILGRPQVALEFSISQHARDLLLFKLIKDYLKCGIVEQKSTRPDSVVFVVYKFSDIFEKILLLLDENPLLGIKGLDYQDFRKVAFMMKDKAHLTEEGIYEIRQIKSGMNKGRK